MKKAIYLSLFLVSFSLYSCGGGENESPKAKESGEQTTTEDVYVCPMHCEGDKTYSVPGSCGVCGMDLEKKE